MVNMSKKLSLLQIQFIFVWFVVRFVHAAKAFEECDRTYKAVFAKPKEQYQRQQGGGRSRDYMGGDSEPLLDRIVTCTHIGQFLTFFSSLCDIYMFLDDCKYRESPQI